MQLGCVEHEHHMEHKLNYLLLLNCTSLLSCQETHGKLLRVLAEQEGSNLKGGGVGKLADTAVGGLANASNP